MRVQRADRARRVTIGFAVALAAGVALAGWSGLGALQDEGGEAAYSAFNGKQTYKTFCINCHGASAKGDGYLVDSLKVRPADLTALAKDNGGEFPSARVRASIDGQKPVKGHGMREMPVWGDVFLWPEGDSPERREHVKRKLGELVEFLRSIQEPASGS